jgi:diamine N-acetyltransferase
MVYVYSSLKFLPGFIMYQTSLYPTNIDDIDFVIQSEQDPQNADFVYQWSKKEHLQALNNPKYKHYIIRDTLTNKSCGYVILDDVDSPSNCINLRRIVVTCKGHKIGQHTLWQIQNIVFTELFAHRLWLDVYTDNIRAYNLYLKAGFIVEGCLRDSYLLKGQYKSQYIMSVLSSEFTAQDEKATSQS